MIRRPVVFDTNVVVSALLFGGAATRRLRQLWREGDCTPLVCAFSAAELLRVLAYPKFKLTVAEQEELLGDYLPFARIVKIPDPAPAVPACRDPHDMPFLHLAAASGATLVTGDADLLVLAADCSFPIIGIEAFMANLPIR